MCDGGNNACRVGANRWDECCTRICGRNNNWSQYKDTLTGCVCNYRGNDSRVSYCP